MKAVLKVCRFRTGGCSPYIDDRENVPEIELYSLFVKAFTVCLTIQYLLYATPTPPPSFLPPHLFIFSFSLK
jgi:hypothetical protein